jgi:hypothetical protein
MAAPNTHKKIIDAPDPQKMKSPRWLYQYLFDIWKRTGGETSSVANLAGLEASVDELNTLVGINRGEGVQTQLNQKENKANLKTMAYQDATSVAITGGAITGTSISQSPITIEAGTCVGCNIKLHGTLHVSMVAVGNVGSGEDKLLEQLRQTRIIKELNSNSAVQQF